MIGYLINNTINATFVADATNNHHSRTGPKLTSWRDLVDFFLGLVFIVLIYLLLCRAGFTPCDNALSFLFQPVFTRFQRRKQQEEQQQQQQQTPPLPTVLTRTNQQNRMSPRSPINSFLDDSTLVT